MGVRVDSDYICTVVADCCWYITLDSGEWPQCRLSGVEVVLFLRLPSIYVGIRYFFDVVVDQICGEILIDVSECAVLHVCNQETGQVAPTLYTPSGSLGVYDAHRH